MSALSKLCLIIAALFIGVCSKAQTLISDAAGLAAISSTPGGSYKLTADIDASSIGIINNFTGTLDGDYHTISGLSHALFNTITGGTVKNVRLADVSISGGQDAGAIANTATGGSKIYNCGVLSGSVSGSGNVGGLVGTISGGTYVVNNYNYASIDGGTYAAGVVGNNTVTKNYVNSTNDDFSSGVITGQPGICTYQKDCQSNATTLYWKQTVPDWNIGTNNVDGPASGVVKYGSNFWIGGPGYTPPASGPDGTNGYALGMVAVWTATVQYTKQINNLPAGTYTLEVPVYNTAGTIAIAQNLIGVKVGNQQYTYVSTTQYPVGQWVTETITFTLNQQTNVTLSVGYKSANEGSGAMPHLFIDRVKIISGNTQNNMVANCVNYGTQVSGTNTYPVYGGTDLDNKKNPLYDFFLYDGATYREDIKSTNGALPAEARFLNRFEYIRATLNAEKKLAAYYLFGTQDKTDQNKIGKWVLDTLIAPYPVIKPWFGSDGKAIKYPSLVNPDVSKRSVGTLSVNISGYGTVSLPISDQNEAEFDYGYHKVQLPYYNDYFDDNYKANSVVTGWKITSVTGGTAGTFSKTGSNAYNFADRNCTQKDLYNVSGRVFAQGGFYYVPEGVTGITIEPYWANDVVYLYNSNIDKVFGMNYTETNYGPAYVPTFNVPNGARTFTSLRNAHNALTATTNVYDHAIVLIGNINFRMNGQPFDNNNLNKGYTIMSIDEDKDNEPDYVEIYGHVDRRPVPPTRLDFVHQVGVSWVKKPMGETLQAYSGIPLTRGHFEITETAFARFTEFETGTHVNRGPLIFNAGLIDQFVTNRDSNNPNIDYAILGGHTYFNAYTPGSHPDATRNTTFWPVSVMGGEYDEFYLTGISSGVAVDQQDGRVYTNGGKMGTFASGYWEQLNGNAYLRFDHTKVKEFYGGSINPAKPITGNIDIIINNSDVEFFCAGPKAGNMTQGKTVITVANNTKFGTYVGAGYGGSSVARVQQKQNVNGNDYMYYKNTFFNDYFNTDYLKFVNNQGILVSYAIEFMPGSGGMGNSLNPTHVTRFYNEYAQLSLARTYNVTSTLNGCTITGNFYGGPYSGTVGTNANAVLVKSTLKDCAVEGSVFGGGKSAEIPSITVYPKEASALKDPLYNGQFGVYYQEGEDKFPVYPAGTEYTWVAGERVGNATDKTLGTDVDLTNLGTIFGNTELTIDGGTIAGSVFGAGDASKVTGTTAVTITGNATIANDVYGGANQANVGGSSVVNMLSGSANNVFGANNVSGTKSGTVTVNINQQPNNTVLINNSVYGAGNQADYRGNPLVNMINGTVTGSVFGGGLSAKVTGNTDVEVTGGRVITAVYGGGALADVTGNTTVNLFGGTVNDVYGGGLGRLADTENNIEAVAALVGGNTTVTLGKSTTTTTGETTTKVGSIVTGSIFGCNNLNGTPQGHAKVTIVKTTPKPEQESGDYDVFAVYGGGNKAAYIPTSDTDFAEVEVLDCDNVIKYVYGGGNAASSPATQVTINGGRMYYVFGGGNGAGEGNPGADIGYKDFTYNDEEKEYGPGTTNVYINGGVIETVFGGSNTRGNIREAANVHLDDKGVCDFDVKSVYGAGNEAEMYGNGNLIIGCIPGLEEIYGGAKNADILGNTSLTITNGHFGKVFGGNNLGGTIAGSVQVFIDETGCHPVVIDTLYGGGNKAAYTAPTADTYGEKAGRFPEVNVISCTKIGQVFGGGLGKEAVITGNPTVNINKIYGRYAKDYDGLPTDGVYKDDGDKDKLGEIGDVFGGGNAADVVGNTYVNIATKESESHLINWTDAKATPVSGVPGANITGNVYGGGSAANVTGKTHVTVGRKTTTNP